MEEVETIYEKGAFRILKPARIESDVVTVRILNRNEVLTEEDMGDILEVVSEREKDKCYKLNEVFR